MPEYLAKEIVIEPPSLSMIFLSDWPSYIERKIGRLHFSNRDFVKYIVPIKRWFLLCHAQIETIKNRTNIF